MIGALTVLGLALLNSAPRLLGRGGSGGDGNAADTLPLERLPLELAPQPPTDVSAPLRALLHDEQQLRRLRESVELTQEDVQRRAAARWRIAQLRSEIQSAEREIDALKESLGSSGSVRPGLLGSLARRAETLAASSDQSVGVLRRQLSRQRDPVGFLLSDAQSALRLMSNSTLAYNVARNWPKLMGHTPAIYTRLALLEPHAPGIMAKWDKYLPIIEPNLDRILEKLETIEPHLPYIIEHFDTLAPHCGALLKHCDALLLYADEEEEWLPSLIEYTPVFAPKLDYVAPHLPLLRPHLPRLVQHMPQLVLLVDFYLPHVAVSANADVLVFYFGWLLRVPFVPYLLCLPGVPRFVSLLSRLLPKKPVRGRTSDYICDWEDCELSYEANANHYYAVFGDADDEVQAIVASALRKQQSRDAQAMADEFSPSPRRRLVQKIKGRLGLLKGQRPRLRPRLRPVRSRSAAQGV